VRAWLALVDRVLEKHNVPTRAIVSEIRGLSNRIQVMLHHVDQLTPVSRVQKKHVAEIKSAMKEAASIMHKIQNLAAIEIEDVK